MSVRVSPVSRGAALMIIAVGILTFVYVNGIEGIAFVLLGVVLYWLLYRFARRVEREVKGAETVSKQ